MQWVIAVSDMLSDSP